MLLCLWMAEHWVVVCTLEQGNIVSLTVGLESSLQVLRVPLLVVFSRELFGSFPQVVIIASEQDHGVWVDVALELGGVALSQLLWVDFLLLVLLLNWIAFVIDFLLFGCRLLRRDEEDFNGSLVADGVAIEDVASVLAVILAESPSESLAHHLRRDLLLTWVAGKVLIDLALETEWLELIVSLSLVDSKLLQLSVVDSLSLSPQITVDWSLFSTLSRGTFTFFWLAVILVRGDIFDLLLLL